MLIEMSQLSELPQGEVSHGKRKHGAVMLAAVVEGALVLEWLWLFGGVRPVNSVTEAAKGDHEDLNS